MMNRRFFLKGLVAAPVIVRAASLMPVKRMLWVPQRVDFYVNSTAFEGDGSLHRPWATLQQAMDYISNSLDLGGEQVTVNVGPGVYQGADLSLVGDRNVTIVGAGSERTMFTPMPGSRDMVFLLKEGDGINHLTLDNA